MSWFYLEKNHLKLKQSYDSNIVNLWHFKESAIKKNLAIVVYLILISAYCGSQIGVGFLQCGRQYLIVEQWKKTDFRMPCI